MGDKLFWQMREHSKLVKAAKDVGIDEREVPKVGEEPSKTLALHGFCYGFNMFLHV